MWLVPETIRTDHARLIRSSGLTFHLGHSMTGAHRYDVCNFEKRGAFAMSKKNWDRVPIDAQSIDAPLSRAAVFLVVTVASELTALTKVCPANPTSLDLPASALVGDEDADFVGGSYVVVQKYLHDLSAWAKIPTPLQEEIIGRTKIDNIEIDDDDAPRKSHKSLATIVDAGGNEYDILRDNMPFGPPGQREFGTYFIGYSRYLWVIEKMLQRMYVGDPPGAYDRLLDFSTPHTGTTFFAPSRPTLQKLAQAAHAKLTAPTP